jgi:hypothetical protein
LRSGPAPRHSKCKACRRHVQKNTTAMALCIEPLDWQRRFADRLTTAEEPCVPCGLDGGSADEVVHTLTLGRAPDAACECADWLRQSAFIVGPSTRADCDGVWGDRLMGKGGTGASACTGCRASGLWPKFSTRPCVFPRVAQRRKRCLKKLAARYSPDACAILALLDTDPRRSCARVAQGLEDGSLLGMPAPTRIPQVNGRTRYWRGRKMAERGFGGRSRANARGCRQAQMG